MKYIVRAHRMTKMVKTAMDNNPKVVVDLAYLFNGFSDISSKYDINVTTQTMVICKGKNFLNEVLDDQASVRFDIGYKGLIFLTYTGYLDELAGSIAKFSTAVTWLIAVAALVVSILVALSQ